MSAKPGQRIVVESETVGTPTREGEILEIIQGAVSVRYRVRWADGHESIFSPSGGAAKVLGGSASGARSTGAKTTGTTARAKTTGTTARAKTTGTTARAKASRAKPRTTKRARGKR